jgi:hypothetical protein
MIDHRATEDMLIDDLNRVLDEVRDRSGCDDMLPLWFIATSKVRSEYLWREPGRIVNVPQKIRAWLPPKRSKYSALAAWRHAVLFTRVLERMDDEPRRAVEGMYFVPAPENEPPYSWSAASSRAPDAGSWSTPNAFDVAAKRGCSVTVDLLGGEVDVRRADPSADSQARAAFIEAGTRDGSLRDVLRYATLTDEE